MSQEINIDNNSQTGEEMDKKRKRNDVSSASDIGEHSFDLDAKQAEEDSIKSKYQTAKPKDKKKKKSQKIEKSDSESVTELQNIEKQGVENQRTTQAIYEQMKRINNKIDSMVSKEDLESMFTKMIDCKINEIVVKVKDEVYKSVTHRIDIVEGELHTSKIELDTLTKNVKILNDKIKSKDETIDKLEKEIEKTKQVNIERVDEIEQYTRRNSVRLNGPGLPLEKEGERENAEQTTKVAIQVLNEKMGMALENRDIDIAHRIGIQRRQVPRPIILKFVSRNDKVRSLKDKKTKLRGTGIYIQEDLTQLKARVLKEARESRETDSAWSKDGHIYIKLSANGKIDKIQPCDYEDWLSR